MGLSHAIFERLVIPVLAATVGGLLLFHGCSPDSPRVRPEATAERAGQPAGMAASSPREPLILQASEGERRVRRPRPVLEREEAPPLSAEDLAAIRERHGEHITFERP